MLANIAAAKLKYEGLITSLNKVQSSAIGLRNYPNPVKASTKISYQLPKEGMVALKIYDALGNVVATLVNSKQSGGMHTIDFNAKDLSRGIYSYKLIFGDQVTTSKMIIVK
jgi:flagellar hook assembly protein FlgD